MRVMKKISIVTNCYNEEGNIREVYDRVKQIMKQVTWAQYEHIFIDNASTDNTINLLRALANEDKSVKVILNSRNFGQIRSSNHALLNASGDAVIHIVADLQDPPELIPEFLSRWRDGFPVVIGQKKSSKDTLVMSVLRKFYYWF